MEGKRCDWHIPNGLSSVFTLLQPTPQDFSFSHPPPPYTSTRHHFPFSSVFLFSRIFSITALVTASLSSHPLFHFPPPRNPPPYFSAPLLYSESDSFSTKTRASNKKPRFCLHPLARMHYTPDNVSSAGLSTMFIIHKVKNKDTPYFTRTCILSGWPSESFNGMYSDRCRYIFKHYPY